MTHHSGRFKLAPRDGSSGNSKTGPIPFVIAGVVISIIFAILLMTWAKSSHYDERERRHANNKKTGWTRPVRAVPLKQGASYHHGWHGVPHSHAGLARSHGSRPFFSASKPGEGPDGVAESTIGSESGMLATPPPSYHSA